MSTKNLRFFCEKVLVFFNIKFLLFCYIFHADYGLLQHKNVILFLNHKRHLLHLRITVALSFFSRAAAPGCRRSHKTGQRRRVLRPLRTDGRYPRRYSYGRMRSPFSVPRWSAP